MFPVMPMRHSRARLLSAQVTCCSMATPHCTAAGLVVAKRRAASAIFSRGTQVISSTRSSGYSATRALNSSQPWM